ncbi:MAG TPA: XRE family transcriptional regulator [Woeseiaceae bacterium]|nr:XRE family transcriptional regulator [Woeseiaceae bacterium]
MSGRKFDSVWDAIEDTSEAAANMKLRAELMIALQDRVGRQPGTQSQKAEKLGITQPRLNDLLRGQISKFSLDALVNLASRAGLRVDLRLHRAA